VEPLVPFSEINELVCNLVSSVLIENLVNCASKSFRVSVREVLIVVEKDSRVVVLVVQRLEILGVVRQEDSAGLTTLLNQFGVSRVFTEPVFRLFHVIPTLSKQSLEDSANVLVEQNLCTRHCTVSFGLSEDLRTRSKADSFSASNLRISSM
jgi:hypothetical protein